MPLRTIKKLGYYLGLSCRTLLLMFVIVTPEICFGQFTSEVQGVVTDSTGAVIPNATVVLTNTGTNYTLIHATDATGNFRFVSLPPGPYSITVTASGFDNQIASFNLTADIAKNVPVTMAIARSVTKVEVTTAVPILDTADTGEHATLNYQTMRDLPLNNNNTFTQMNFVPGVTGINGSTDNFQNGYAPKAGTNGNGGGSTGIYTDGVNVANITGNGQSSYMINPDSVQEITYGMSDFTAEHGSLSSGMVVVTTTKSGSNQFHGSGSWYFTNQDLLAKQSIPSITSYLPFHKNDVSGGIGGPIWKNKTFFFASVDVLRSTQASSGTTQWEDPAFVAWAKSNFPNTIGTQMFSNFPTGGVKFLNVADTAANLSGYFACGPTSPTGIPCDLNVIDFGSYNWSSGDNGLQYTVRVDHNLTSKDRLYGNFMHTDTTQQNIVPRPHFNNEYKSGTNTGMGNWTHTFNSNLLNEFTFEILRTDNLPLNLPGNYQYPYLGINGVAYEGQTGAPHVWVHINDYRDVVTWVKGHHEFKLGGEFFGGTFLDDDTLDQRPYYNFNSIMDFVQDKIYSGSFGSYNPLTGLPKPYEQTYGQQTDGLFVQDQWRLRSNLNVTLSFRWDDYGNIKGRHGYTFSQIYLSSGNTLQAQMADASVRLVNGNGSTFLPGRLNTNFSPRIGVSWSPESSHNKLRLYGGVGRYYNWITSSAGAVVSGNPPNYIYNNFSVQTSNQPPAAPQIGNSQTYPYGFTVPNLPGTTLDSHGGIPGTNSSVEGFALNIHAPGLWNYVVGMQQELPKQLVFGLSYHGSHGEGSVLPATDFNRYAGDLIQHNGIQERLNSSFGSMEYFPKNVDSNTYNAMLVTLKKDFGHQGSIQGSYNWAHQIDCWNPISLEKGVCNTPHDSGTSRNRIEASGIYRLPTPFKSHLLSRRVLGGWEIGSTFQWQTGGAFGMINDSTFSPVRNSSGAIVGITDVSGDYNADGYDGDLPNQVASLPRKYDRSHFLGKNLYKPAYTAQPIAAQRGYSVSSAQFTNPALGTEGNAPLDYFINPDYTELNSSLIKNNAIEIAGRQVNLQLKLEVFNTPNRVELGGMDNNIGDYNFGTIQSQSLTPRLLQLGAHISF